MIYIWLCRSGHTVVLTKLTPPDTDVCTSGPPDFREMTGDLQPEKATSMANIQKKDFPGEATAQDGAIEAAISIFREKGLSAVSFRSIGESSGIHHATLQFRYGTKRDLLDRVFALLVDQETHAFKAVAEIAEQVRTPTEGAGLYRQVVCGSGAVEHARSLALIEMLIAAVRDSAIRPHAERWLSRLQQSWETAFAFDESAADVGWFLTELQIGLLVAGIGSGRPLETAIANGELVERALGLALPEGRSWFSAFFDEVRQRTFSDRPVDRADQQSNRLTTAGAEIVAIKGADALSFRSVADRAGLTLSAATNNFPKRHDLINAVYDRIFDEIVYSPVRSVSFRDEDTAALYFVDVLLNRQFAGANLGLALAELYLAAARHPSLRDLAWRTRMSRGNEAGRDWAADPTSGQSFDSHLAALWLLGCALTHGARVPDDRLRSIFEQRARFGLKRLKLRFGWQSHKGR